MSVVVCKVLENGYEIAADSITVRGWTQSRGKNTSLSKLEEVNDMVIGSVGTAQEGVLFRMFAASRRPTTSDIPGILEFLSDFSDWKNKKIGEKGIDNSYIIGLDGKAFAIEAWLIEEIVTYEAIGAGKNFALAALYLGESAEKAVETAIELSVMCEAPIRLIRKVVE